MDPQKFYEQREKRQKERLRDRGGMFQPSTPGRMAAALFAKYAPSSSVKPKSPRGRKSTAGAVRKSAGPRKSSAGAPRKSAAAAVRKSTGPRARKSTAGGQPDDGLAPSTPTQQSVLKKRTKKLTIEPVTVVGASAESSHTAGLGRASNDAVQPEQPQWTPSGRMSLVFPPAPATVLFMTAGKNRPPPSKAPPAPSTEPFATVAKNRPPPSKAVHPAFTGQTLVNMPPPPPKAHQSTVEPKKRPRMEESEVSEFVPSPPKRARTRAPSKKKLAAVVDSTDAPAEPKGKGRPKKAVKPDVPKKSTGKAKGKKSDPIPVVPKKSRGKAFAPANPMTPIVEAEEKEPDEGAWVSDREEQVGGSKEIFAAVPASPPKGVKRKTKDKDKDKDKTSTSSRKDVAMKVDVSNLEPEDVPRKRRRAAKGTEDLGSTDTVPKKRPRGTNTNSKRKGHLDLSVKIAAVLSSADSPVKTMHRRYDGKPDPIDCFLSD